MAELRRVKGEYEETLRHAREAVKIDKNNASARLILASTLEYLGRRDEAIKAYRWFDRQLVERAELSRDAAWLTATGQGFYRYSVLAGHDLPRRTKHVLNNMFQMAYEKVDRSYWPARVAAADLLRLKYNNDPEDGSVSDYAAALGINENLPAAYVGLGEVALEDWAFEKVEQRVQEALRVNPNFAPAFHLLSKCRLLERRYLDAAAEAARALTINPNDLTAIALHAAAGACRDDAKSLEQDIARALAINPRCALLYAILGDAMSGVRQYEASERYYLKSIEYEPTDPNPRTELGMMYMQWGLEDKARAALDASWALDPFNVRTFNTLTLLDSLQKFARYESEHFIVRYDDRKDPGLGPYVSGYLEEIYPLICGDYETTLEHKTVIEIFPTHHAFAVRITGKPWIHTVGACTGRVIAMDSPRRDPTLELGPYNMASVLKHEFTHTVTLAATNNLIPHWLTEGLAVWQEDHPRSFNWSGLLADAIRKDELFTLESINWGFMRPRRPHDRQLAYAQSEWMVEYIIERWGYDVVNPMLKRFKGKQTQARVLRELLAIAEKDFDTEFGQWARKQVESWGFDLTPPEDVEKLRKQVKDDPKNAALTGRLAQAELDAGNHERALGIARRALELDEDNSHGLAVQAEVLHLYRGNERSPAGRKQYDDEALPALGKLAKSDADNWIVHKFLGDIALDRKQYDDAERHYRRHQRLCPKDPASYRGLAGVYLKQGRDASALPQLLELAHTDENDSDVRAGIARIHRRRRQLGEATYWYGRALMIAPFSVPLHSELAEVKMTAGDSVGALREYEMLTKLQPNTASHFANAAFAAHKAGQIDRARELASRAVDLDPGSPAKALLP